MGQPSRLKVGNSAQAESKPGELKHLSTRRKRKQFSDSLSSGDRTGNSPNRYRFGGAGVVGPLTLLSISNGRFLESYIKEGDSPVHASIDNISGILSRSGHVKSWLKLRGPSRKAKYDWETDSVPVPWGKGEKHPEQGSEIVPETVRLQPVGVPIYRDDGVPFA